MGNYCCYSKEKPKEKEFRLPTKINYNIFEIKKMVNNYINNENIMTNTNEQDVISSNSKGQGIVKKCDSIDNSSNKENFINKYNYANKRISKNTKLEQIKESNNLIARDIGDNSNEEGISEM